MYCKKCGKEIDNDSRFCVFCGAEQSLGQDGLGECEAQNESKPKSCACGKLKKIISLIVAVLIVVSAAAGIIVYNSAASVAERYGKACIEGNLKQLVKYSAIDKEYHLTSNGSKDKLSDGQIFAAASEELECDVSSWADIYKAYSKIEKESLRDEYGKYKITTEAIKVKDISLRKFKNDNAGSIAAFEKTDNKYFDIDAVSKVKLITLKAKIVGEDTIERESISLYLVKTGLTWKVFSMDDSIASFYKEVYKAAPAAEAPAEEAPAAAPKKS